MPVPAGRRPPYRLDEEPVKSPWIKPQVLYALADRALALDLRAALHSRSGSYPDRVQRARQDAAAVLEAEKPSREAVGLALAQLLLRHYQALHLGHLETKTRSR